MASRYLGSDRVGGEYLGSRFESVRLVAMRQSKSNERTRIWLGFAFTVVSVFAILLAIAIETWWLIALGVGGAVIGAKLMLK